jgi:hypothetical protein
VYLTTMPAADGGGHTAFPALDIAVLPRKGDAILWNNNDEDGIIDEAVHEARAPLRGDNGGARKYVMNVWVNQEPIHRVDAAAYRTR